MKRYFKDKKITVIGLGLLGRGVGDVEFLVKNGADLIVTDLKLPTELKPSLKKLRKYKSIEYVLGKHRLQDFRDRDMILKSADVKPDSPYIKEAEKNKIPVEMSASLFAKLASATIIGVTGTRGKTTTVHMIYEILKSAQKCVFLGGNIKGISTLALLGKVKKSDIVVMELDSWQLKGFGKNKISPHISIFTNLLSDHMNYYKNNMNKYFKDKTNIFKYQKRNDYLITGKEVAKKIKRKSIVPKPLPKNWKLKIIGGHNRENAAFALTAASVAGVSQKIIKKTIENFKSAEGRLQYLKTIHGIKIYNDTTATTPDATIAALKAIGKNQNIILIMGGTDKGLDMSGLIKEIPKYCKAVILLDETGTRKLKNLKFKYRNTNNLKNAIKFAVKDAKCGDTILFSPAFASFGMFKNEYDRGDKFNSLVNSL